MKKVKVISKRKLRRIADRLWSDKIRSKNNGMCEVCKKPANDPHHIISRKNLSVRWDLRNGCLLCSGCHTLNRKSAHLDPMWFVNDFLIKNRMSDYFYLRRMKEKICPVIDYPAIIEKLKES